ncbi:MAG: hypothetical protein ACKO6K_10665 [Chitinophagaceae bacterium]
MSFDLQQLVRPNIEKLVPYSSAIGLVTSQANRFINQFSPFQGFCKLTVGLGLIESHDTQEDPCSYYSLQ